MNATLRSKVPCCFRRRGTSGNIGPFLGLSLNQCIPNFCMFLQAIFNLALKTLKRILRDLESKLGAMKRAYVTRDSGLPRDLTHIPYI